MRPLKQGNVCTHQSRCFSEASTNVLLSFWCSPKRIAWTMNGRSWSSEAAQADMHYVRFAQAAYCAHALQVIG